MENQNEEMLLSEQIQAEVEKKVKELKAADPKLKKVFPILVEGDEDSGEKPYYVCLLYTSPSPRDTR